MRGGGEARPFRGNTSDARDKETLQIRLRVKTGEESGMRKKKRFSRDQATWNKGQSSTIYEWKATAYIQQVCETRQEELASGLKILRRLLRG